MAHTVYTNLTSMTYILDITYFIITVRKHCFGHHCCAARVYKSTYSL